MIMEELLKAAVVRKASDLHLTIGIPPVIRLNGELIQLALPNLTSAVTAECLAAIASAEQVAVFKEKGEVDFSYAIHGFGRFRVNAFKQRGTIALVIRMINEHIPTLEDLGFPSTLSCLTRKSRGLVLVTGPTGSGKSTTLASMVDLINQERTAHIITLEDPIEYLHRHQKSIVNQREIHSDTQSFTVALRAALREDPDVILVGEMRDAETIATAITAAETGHLVFATLHTGDAAQTIDRIIDAFPPHQQQQIRTQLSLTLQGIVSQQLLPRLIGGGRIAALEILLATPAVRNLIREGKTHQIISVIQTSGKRGMQSMDAALGNLYRQGIISLNEATVHASNQDMLTHMFNM